MVNGNANVPAAAGRRRRRFEANRVPAWFTVFNYGVMILLALLFILPFWLMLIASLTPETEIAAKGFRLWADNFTLFAYDYLFSSSNQFTNAFLVTAALTVAGTVNSLFFTTMGAYVLSKRYLPYRVALTVFIFIPMLFNGGLIPYFLVVKTLGMLDSFFALFVPGTISIWNMIIIRNFFMAMPESLEESAILDGANDFTVYFRIILPLSKPILATMVVYTAVGYWNEWYNALIFITRNEFLTTLQLLLRKVLTNTQVTASARGGVKVIQSGGIMPSETMKMAAVMVATLPIIIVYPFLQKYFTQGLLIGSVKG
ncbi:MAG: carbohydrate ABC transporter permease [Clostridiales bacterium]|jgi:ABC-type glycerol-3-phosphate transport system permease component|nr:carbohydrate ABC transporter permease [Clostridiales bacterium]